MKRSYMYAYDMIVIIACRAMPNPLTYNIQFADPEARTLESLGKTYYTQDVTNHGQEIMLCTDWFKSDGVQGGIGGKPEMMFKTTGAVREVLNIIEGEAVRQLRVPVEVMREYGINAEVTENKALYKPLFNSEYLFAKLHRDCTIFNTRRELMKREALGYGEYRVVIHVKGLYIGNLNLEGKVASLTVRIYQIQYRPVNVTCLFESAPGLMTGNLPKPTAQGMQTETAQNSKQNIPPTPQAQASTTGKKNAKKPGRSSLSRQNAMIEPQQQNPTESMATDFFEDFNI